MQAASPWTESALAALPPWVTARILTLIAYVVATSVADGWTDGRPPQIDEGLLAWDGQWYEEIARDGYARDDALRFFPLYPLLGRAVAFGSDGWSWLGLLVLANVAALGVGILAHRIMVEDGHGTAAAQRAAWLVALFPSAFVLVFAYSEALFLVTSMLAYRSLRRGDWAIAAVAAAGAALTRPIGVVLAVPAAIEASRPWWEPRLVGPAASAGPATQESSRSPAARRPLARVAAVVGPVLGAGIYLAWSNGRTSDGLGALRTQEALRGDWVDPVTRLIRGATDLFGDETFGDGLHLPFAVLGLALVTITARRWPVSATVYSALLLVAFLAADNWNSLERYLLNAFPLVLSLAFVTSRLRWERVALAVSGCGFFALAALGFLGAYVP